MCETGGDAWGGRPPRRRGVRGAAIRPLATRWATVAGSALLAKRDAAPLRRARQQATSSRAPAVSTHARPTLPSETSSVHLVARCGRVSRIHNGGEWRAQAGSREWRIDHEDTCACPPTSRSPRRTRHRPRCPPATPVLPTTPVEPYFRRHKQDPGGGSYGTRGRKEQPPSFLPPSPGRCTGQEVRYVTKVACSSKEVNTNTYSTNHQNWIAQTLDVAHEAAVSKHAPTHCVHWHHGHTSKYGAHGRTTSFFFWQAGRAYAR